MADEGYPGRNQAAAADAAAEPADAALVALAKRGDRAAFGRLLRRHQRRVFALGLRWFRNADDADDLVQETFLRVWRSLERFDVDRPFVPWLMTIAVNRAKTFVERARPTEELDERAAWEGPSPEEDAERALLAREVRAAVDALPEEQRIVLHLRAVEGLAYREISEALGVPIGTVMSRLSRARERLRGRLRDDGDDPEREDGPPRGRPDERTEKP
jgi:RNA polymerase sigma-70 factor (ECF subfamily)